MKRWNGWGDEHTTYHFPESAAVYLAEQVGKVEPAPDAALEAVLASVPASRLPVHPLVQTEALERLQHARGQSLPDWIALRSGHIGIFPDGVAYPTDDQQVRDLLAYARQAGIRLIPYGGGTSVVGHINPRPQDAPTLTIDLSRLNQLTDLDEISRLATFGAGVCGPDLEKQLNARGYTLGHYPQSFELSTLGGWIATRSSGQQSYHYGRIEDLFAGGHIETLQGPLDLPCLPASAAGPDLRQMILGSEGRLGVITQAVVRVRPMPAAEAFYGVFFREWEAAAQAVRQIAQARLPVSMARLSDPQETETTLALSGKDNLVAWAKRGLGMLGYGDQRCLLVLGVTVNRCDTGDSRSSFTAAGSQAMQIARAHGGLFTGQMVGKMWSKSRFLTPYLRNTLWERGYALDTLETAMPWKHINEARGDIQSAIRQALAQYDGDEYIGRVLVFSHLSHVYRDGASIYTTYLFRRAADPDETLARWQAMKHAASQAIIAHAGTISHQHGVGVDHAAYLEAEKGALGMRLLQQTASSLDPDGLLNPGKLIGDDYVDHRLA